MVQLNSLFSQQDLIQISVDNVITFLPFFGFKIECNLRLILELMNMTTWYYAFAQS